VFGSSILAWLRQVNRLVVWNGLAVVTWIWAVPFYFRNRERIPLGSAQGAFFFIWLVPGLIIQALVHIGAPGHTLFSVAALCVLGGYVLSLMRMREMLLAGVLVLNAMLFLDFWALPEGEANSAQRTPSLKNAMLFGTFESSIGDVRWLDEVTGTTLKEIKEFTPKGRPAVIVTTDTYADQWFMNWRIGRYYLPGYDFWVLYNDDSQKHLEHIRRDRLLENREARPLAVPVSRQTRVLWLIEPQSAIYRQIAAKQELKGGKYVFYSDMTSDSQPLMLDEFAIVPAPGDYGIQ
jgi:hypothetical protein